MEPLLGEIVFVAFNFVPNGYMQCNGALLPINQYTALFSLLGTTYGGNGTTTFAIPTLPTKPEPEMKGLYLIAINGVYPSRG